MSPHPVLAYGKVFDWEYTPPGALRITKCDKIEDIVQDDIDKAKKDRVDTWSTNVPN